METKFESGRHHEVAREWDGEVQATGWYIKVCPIVRHGETIVYKPSRFMILFVRALIFRCLKFDFPVNNEIVRKLLFNELLFFALKDLSEEYFPKASIYETSYVKGTSQRRARISKSFRNTQRILRNQES